MTHRLVAVTGEAPVQMKTYNKIMFCLHTATAPPQLRCVPFLGKCSVKSLGKYIISEKF